MPIITLGSTGNDSGFNCLAADTGLLLGDGVGFLLTWANAPPVVTSNANAHKEMGFLKFMFNKILC